MYAAPDRTLMIRKIIGVAALFAVLVTTIWSNAVAQNAALKRISVLTNYVFHGRHAPLFVGVERGFYKEAGFDVQIAPATGSGFVVTAVEAGRADFGLADASVVVQAIAK